SQPAQSVRRSIGNITTATANNGRNSRHEPHLRFFQNRGLQLPQDLCFTKTAFHVIERAISLREKCFDAFAIIGEYSNTDTHRNWRCLFILRDLLADSCGNLRRTFRSRLGENHGKFVAAIARSGVYLSTMSLQDLTHSAECMAPH